MACVIMSTSPFAVVKTIPPLTPGTRRMQNNKIKMSTQTTYRRRHCMMTHRPSASSSTTLPHIPCPSPAETSRGWRSSLPLRRGKGVGRAGHRVPRANISGSEAPCPRHVQRALLFHSCLFFRSDLLFLCHLDAIPFGDSKARGGYSS